MKQNVGNYTNDNQRCYKDVREGKSGNAIIQIWHVSTAQSDGWNARISMDQSIMFGI